MFPGKPELGKELDSDTREQFTNLCEENEWFPLVSELDVGYEIAFLSPYPEVEWVVRAPTIEACVKKAVTRKE